MLLFQITISFRQTFDFLGFQWTAIVANFCQIIAVTIGLFGTCRNKPRLVAMVCKSCASTFLKVFLCYSMVCHYLPFKQYTADNTALKFIFFL